VHNHLQDVLPGEDYRDGAILTTAASNALALIVTVPDGAEATARDGNLTLTGAVGDGPAARGGRTGGRRAGRRGHVRARAEHHAVGSAAWMADGVMQVRDALDITS
jgi:hypothetical protein